MSTKTNYAVDQQVTSGQHLMTEGSSVEGTAQVDGQRTPDLDQRRGGHKTNSPWKATVSNQPTRPGQPTFNQ